ncbi:hypothetical protein Hanom_Chr02g00096181 [Helianthus anomalus]
MSDGSSRDGDGQLSVPTTLPAGIIWSLSHPPSHKKKLITIFILIFSLLLRYI